MGTLLETRVITKRFGGLTALNKVDFQLEEGRIASIIGPNGAGKTTLFNVLTGIYHPEEGEATFKGRSVLGLRPDQIAALGICRTFQNIRLFANMSVVENVLVGMHSRVSLSMGAVLARGRRFHEEEARLGSRASTLLEVVGLAAKTNELAKNLPYGEQRRLELARALASSPMLLLLDEPTAGMTQGEARSLMALLRRLITEYELTILLIEHNMRFIMAIAERIVVLDAGAKFREGTPGQIQNDKEVQRIYLGEEEEV